MEKAKESHLVQIVSELRDSYFLKKKGAIIKPH